MLGRISALFLLAWALLKTLLGRVGGGDALQGFAERYQGEGIVGVDVAESKILSQAGRCTACGRCDVDEGPRIAESAVGYRGVMSFVLAGLRSLTDYDATARMIGEVPEGVFERAQEVCPEGVPLVALSRLVRHHASRVGQLETS